MSALRPGLPANRWLAGSIALRAPLKKQYRQESSPNFAYAHLK
jgi:hypothetical protein